MTTTTVEIRRVAEWDALHCNYQGQTERQGCYIELDCQTGLLTATYNAEIGNAIPFSVYHGHDRRWGIPCLIADAANDLLDEISPLAQRVLDGYTSEWDGNNHVARLSDDAQAAEDEIERLIDDLRVDETNGISDADAGEWLTETDPAITAQTTDEEIAALAEQAEQDAAYERIVLIDAEGYLTRLRDEMRADAED